MEPDVKTYEVTGDYKWWIIAFLVIVIGCFYLGAKMQDTTIRDNFQNIAEQKKIKSNALYRIDEENKRVKQADISIKTSVDIIQKEAKKYSVTFK